VLRWQTLHCDPLDPGELPHVIRISTADPRVVAETLAAISLRA
jgi:hypothetical protein